MPISRREFLRLPNIPSELREQKLAWQTYEALSRSSLSVVDLARVLGRPFDKVAHVLNLLMRTGFVGFHLASDKKEVRFYWVQTAEGEPALKGK